jgi:hypothetical protein
VTWTAIRENGFDTEPYLNPAPVIADAAGLKQ